jgi:glutamate-1-semialdehyde 2,1-aminomutase
VDRLCEIDKHLDLEAAWYLKKTPSSRRVLQRSIKHMPLGVASSFQSHYPYSLVIDSGHGAYVRDLDGNQYLDLHSGFGCNIFGHTHEAIVHALKEQTDRGIHFAAPIEKIDKYAALLCERIDMEQVRFTTSGTEATMDAIRLARAVTKRDKIIKIEGAYHGHHDTVLISVKPNLQHAGSANRPRSVVDSEGIPNRTREEVIVVPFNDLKHLEEAVNNYQSQISCIIMEPILCNLGMVVPNKGYLEGVREICDKAEILLIFDQVKTGVTVAFGGIQELYGVKADIHCLGKAIGGGASVGAFGGSEEIMQLVTEARVLLDGTFAGNPLTIAAGLAALDKVLVPKVYEHLDNINEYLRTSIDALISEHQLPFHLTTIKAKGGVFFSPQPVKNYREWYEHTDNRLAQLYWVFLANRGIWMAPGADEQWTLPCMIQTSDIDKYLEVFEEFAKLVAALPESTL